MFSARRFPRKNSLPRRKPGSPNRQMKEGARMPIRGISVRGAIVLAAIGLAACEGNAPPPVHPWSHVGGGDRAFSRYAALDQINETNVKQLAVAWRRPAIDSATLADQDRQYQESYRRMPDSIRRRMPPPSRTRGGMVRGVPIIVDSMLYVPNHRGLAEA